MSNLIPSIGAKGKYRLHSPFDVLIKDVAYTCVAIRRLTDFITMGRDPKELYYDPHGLDDTVWDEDSSNPEVCIVSLRSDSGLWLYVPSTFILSFPDINSIPYSVRVLGVSLGAIPESLDLSNLYTNMIDLVRDTIGVESEVKSVVISETTLLPNDTHETLEIARNDLIESSQTQRATIIELHRQLDALRDTNHALEEHIKTRLL